MTSHPQEPAAVQLDLFAAGVPLELEAALVDPPHPHESEPGSAHERGAIHERHLESDGRRKRQGAYYTPPDVVEGLLDLALDPLLRQRAEGGVTAVSSLRILDPACGSGNFLAEAGRRIALTLEGLGVGTLEARAIAFGECLIGVDIDEGAVSICREVLNAASGLSELSSAVTSRVLQADSLLMIAPTTDRLLDDTPLRLDWHRVAAEVRCEGGGFDLVVGNPPFLSQLGNETSRSREYALDLNERFGQAAAGYSDPAALFLLMATMVARPVGGTVCMIEPQSVLSARDAQHVRRKVLDGAAIDAIWVADSRIFDASVDVCALAMVRGAPQAPVRVSRGREFEELPSVAPPGPDTPSWSALLAAVKDFPDAEVKGAGSVGDIATATADFRDQYYGLAPHMVDSADQVELPRLVTSGAIDPADLLWGTRPARFNKIRYEYPRVRVADLDEKLSAWSRKRLVPKVLLATQTKVLEAIVDMDGSLLPSVPVITVTASPGDLWRIAALLTSPPVTLVAAQRHLGAALSSDALKLSAKDVLALPLPASYDAWERAGHDFEMASAATDDADRRAHLISSAKAMCEAFEIRESEPLVAWWVDRLPGGKRGS